MGHSYLMVEHMDTGVVLSIIVRQEVGTAYDALPAGKNMFTIKHFKVIGHRSKQMAPSDSLTLKA